MWMSVLIILIVIAAVLLAARLLMLMNGRQWRQWNRAAEGRCWRCGYDLRGSAGECPECGAEPLRLKNAFRRDD